MKTVGIICEYNPFHLGHDGHIHKTRQALGDSTAVVCVISGNYVQRGDLAVFNKHARARMALLSGADLVVELQAPYALQSAEGFAKAGVHILDMLGICGYLSFGSESGEIETLRYAADLMASDRAHAITKQWLEEGISYAAAQQKAADALLGPKATDLKTPNNVLGIEYLKALNKVGSNMKPMTVERTGGDHDSDTGYSASALRKSILRGEMPKAMMTDAVVNICKEEIDAGRGPVSIKNAELAILSRLRNIKDYSTIPGVSEGLDRRIKKHTANETSITAILEKIKTKRYTMSRLRRILMCATLGISKEIVQMPPQYIRVLAMNEKGMELLGIARKKAKLPIITKPASVYKLNETAIKIFELEASATDFYVLAYPNEAQRVGGQEWRQSPIIIK